MEGAEIRSAGTRMEKNGSPRKVGSQIRVLVLDRNRMSSQLLAGSLANDSRFEATVAQANEISALAARRDSNIAVISVDLDSGPGQGIQIARALNRQHPQIGILILLDRIQREPVIEAFRCGARGVFCRTQAVSDFFTCLEHVSRGEIWAGKVESDYLLEALKSVPSPNLVHNDGIQGLTRRELQVVQYAAQGFTNKSIADELGLSEHTVKNYLFRAFEKLRVSSRVELLFYLTVKGQVFGKAEPGTDREEDRITSYRRAAEAGMAPAQLALGLAYWNGSGVDRDLESAYFWLRMAERHSADFGNQSQALAERIKKELNNEDVDQLDRKVADWLQTHRHMSANSLPDAEGQMHADDGSLDITMLGPPMEILRKASMSPLPLRGPRSEN